MLELQYEMTYWERIEGPLAPTTGSPLGERLCWLIADATLMGPRIEARLAMPGTDWLRIGSDGLRRPDMRAQLVASDGAVILMRYDTAVIRPTPGFLDALERGQETAFGDQYMCMAPQFEVGAGDHAWLVQSLFVARGRLAGPRQIEYELHRVV
jgi:hypothetical protein